MRVALIDYGSGNLRSAAKAFEKASLGTRHEIQVTNNPKELALASHIVLPGVGAFADCMAGLAAVPGMLDALQEHVIINKKPFFGICVGMQMMLERGFENGEHRGLGWVAGDVVPITPKDSSYKIPHMGWNELVINQADHPLLGRINAGEHVYFVHSYHAVCGDKNNVLATVEYGASIAAIIAKDNMMGTQFHPEKSQAAGLAIITNFLNL